MAWDCRRDYMLKGATPLKVLLDRAKQREKERLTRRHQLYWADKFEDRSGLFGSPVKVNDANDDSQSQQIRKLFGSFDVVKPFLHKMYKCDITSVPLPSYSVLGGGSSGTTSAPFRYHGAPSSPKPVGTDRAVSNNLDSSKDTSSVIESIWKEMISDVPLVTEIEETIGDSEYAADGKVELQRTMRPEDVSENLKQMLGEPKPLFVKLVQQTAPWMSIDCLVVDSFSGEEGDGNLDSSSGCSGRENADKSIKNNEDGSAPLHGATNVRKTDFRCKRSRDLGQGSPSNPTKRRKTHARP